MNNERMFDSLSAQLKTFREMRPEDYWMDEFIKKAERLESELRTIKELAEEHKNSCGDGCYENDRCFLCKAKIILRIK